MKKRITIIILLCGFLLAIIAISKNYIEYNQKRDLILDILDDDFKKRFISYNDFTVKNSEKNVTYSSDKAKISIITPIDWELIGEDFGFFSLKTKDFIPLNEDWMKKPIASQGCWTEVNIKIDKVGEDYKNITSEYLEHEEYINNDEDENEQIIDLGYSKAMQTIIHSKGLDGDIVMIRIPNNNITYEFSNYVFGKDKEKCKLDFENILSSLVIHNINEE